MECPICQQETHDAQTFYVCATNTATRGFFSQAVERAVAFPSRCCWSCYRAMLRRDRLRVFFGAVGLATFAATLLLLKYAEQWFTPPRARLAFGVIAVCVTASVLLSSKKARRVGDAGTQAKAIRMAQNLDHRGEPIVFPKANRPAAKHYRILDGEWDGG